MTIAKPTLSDMPVDGWVDRCPLILRPYLKLMRLDRPIGTWLLLLPCWWSAALAAESLTDLRIYGLGMLFAVGAVIMRGAGCVINDIADRDFDGRVERTATRPIPAGQVSVLAAVIFVGVLMLIGLAVLVQFNRFTLLLGAASVPILVVYPFMKRITDWPQAWLGLAFNWGALVGWSAMTGRLDWPAACLYVGGICWTLGYDTIYAHQDKADDVKIGVRSSALALGRRTRPFLVVMYTLVMGLFIAAFVGAESGPWAAPFLLAAAAHLVWQVVTVDSDDAPNCLRRFKSNRDFGLLVTLAALAAHI
ncbi:MAG: 4-hydroxybenzoate octaprenyltransferase [Rhodospirillaceae bacterium]|nr:4-hydroxybenzoate octaprenyltransferase [Rhodospirillaceae bacterium]